MRGGLSYMFDYEHTWTCDPKMTDNDIISTPLKDNFNGIQFPKKTSWLAIDQIFDVKVVGEKSSNQKSNFDEFNFVFSECTDLNY